MILRLLQQDGALTTPKLAERLSLSVTPCWRRLKRLEKEGYIRDYQANLDRQRLGFDVLAFVQLSFGVHTDTSANLFEAMILDHPEVLSCHKITGSADYMLQVVATDLVAYGDFIEQVLRKISGVSVIHSSLALREIKSTNRLPIGD